MKRSPPLPATRQKADFERSNTIAARVILADIDKYGADSLMVEWAKAFLSRMEAERGDQRRAAA